jgi:hypothetical protein
MTTSAHLVSDANAPVACLNPVPLAVKIDSESRCRCRLVYERPTDIVATFLPDASR